MDHVTDVVFDPFSREMHEDPYPTYRMLREHSPLYYNDDRRFWALSRFVDVQAASRDWGTFSCEKGVDLDDMGQVMFGPGNFIELDPPRHRAFRKLVAPFFGSKRIQALEGPTRVRVQELLQPLLDEGKGDFATQLAWPLPVTTVADLLGFPREDNDRLADLFKTALHREPDEREIPSEAMRAGEDLRSYFEDMAADRRRRPRRDDLLSTIVTAEIDGRRLSEEIVGICFLIMGGGADSPASLLANSLLLLAAHPDQRARLLTEPEAIPPAVEEMLRYEAPSQNLARTTTRDVELHGKLVPAGSRVLLLYGAANRDEQRWEDADRLDLWREPKRHLAFGDGIHFCLGAPLARLQARVLIAEVLARIPEYAINGKIQRLYKQNERGLEGLPVAW